MPLLLLLACAGKESVDSTPAAETGDSAIDTADSSDSGETDSETAADDTAPPDSDTACDTGLTWYADRDGDGHGNRGEEAECGSPFPISGTPDDCDDTHATVYVGAPELLQSGRDDNCDGYGAGASVVDAPVWAVSDGVEDSRFAWGTSLPGDINGDGAADLVLSGARPDPYGVYRLALSAFSGPITPSDTTQDAAYADSTLFLRSNGNFRAMCSPGDTDADGLGDVLVNVYWGDGSATLYLLAGEVPSGVMELESLGAQTWEFDRTVTQPRGCATPGDRTGDGLPDFVVGDPEASGRDGEVYVMPGSDPPAQLTDAYAVVRGDYNTMGLILATTGDLDGDGVGDFSADAAGWDAGYLILETPPGVSQASEVGVHVYIDEKQVYRHTTVQVAAVGDINGDGYADASFYESNSPYQLVKFGPFVAGTTVDLQTESDVGFRSDNDGVEEPYLGISTPLGDWDGDGYDDLAIANKQYVPEENRVGCDYYDTCHAGAVFLVAGPVQAGVYDLEVSADRIDNWGYGLTQGNALASGSDLDQDGFDDLLISSSDVGYAYLVFGGGRW